MPQPHSPTNRPIGNWYLGLKAKPSFAFLALMFLLGFMLLSEFMIGPIFLLGSWYLIERFFPTKPLGGGGLMHNRTKAALDAISIVLLWRMINLFIESAQIAQYNLPTQLAGFGSPFGSGADQKAGIALFSIFVAAWVGYQAYLAKKANQIHWMWVFGSFAVAYVPFFHFFLGPLWMVVDLILILVLLVSIFAFRLPKEWPTIPQPFSFATPPPLPAPESLETELVSLKRLLDQNLLSQGEYDTQKQNILRKHCHVAP